ncbi:MAG: phenylalanine--tRNA ligase subunit beta [Candidatus Muiribacteriota bacterium]
MKVTYKWLKDFVDIDVKAEELKEIFPEIGLEVDDFFYAGRGLDKVVVGLVTKCAKHPDADKLSLCEVTDGKNSYQIVCGAPNVRENIKIPLALEGAKLPVGLKIKKAKIRGVESRGMICSEKELGLSESSDGILILNDNASVGQDFISYYGLDDFVISVETFANRPDHMGVIGVARDLAVYFDKDFNPFKDVEVNSNIDKDEFEVIIENKEACPRYMGRFIKGIKTARTPTKIVNRLQMCGLRSINFLVDITNYIMLETGQPMHAFDASLFKDKKVFVKNADEISFNALNEKKYNLNNDDLVISSSDEAVAIAGVIGGANSEVSDSTSEVFLESAFFSQDNVSITSRRAGVWTDSSARFEKGTDVNMVDYAIKYASKLIKDNIEGAEFYNIIDSFPGSIQKNKVKFPYESIEKLLGYKIPSDEVKRILNRLPVEEKGEDLLEVDFCRPDLQIKEDFIEEIAKFYGFDKIPDKTPHMSSVHYKNDLGQYFDLSYKMSELGFNEVINYSFGGDNSSDSPALENPLSDELGYMRTNMWDSLLENVEYNAKRGAQNHFYFERGKIYLERNKKFSEKNIIAAVASGNFYENYGENVKSDFYFLKGVVESLLSEYKLSFDGNNTPHIFHPGVSARIISDGNELGFVGKIHPKIKSKFFSEAYYFEIYPDNLHYITENKKTQISRFPSSKFDLSLIVPQNVSYGVVIDLINNMNIKKLDDITLTDIYRGDNIPQNTTSLSFRLRFSDVNKTMDDEETNAIVNKMLKKLNKINVGLREK